MKFFDWSDEKNAQLTSERGISFEQIVFWIANGGLLAVIEHPNKARYANQRIFVVNVEDYAYLVPFVEDDERIFLKTIIPSRKMTGRFIRSKTK